MGEGTTAEGPTAKLETREGVLEPELYDWIQRNRSTAFCAYTFASGMLKNACMNFIDTSITIL